MVKWSNFIVVIIAILSVLCFLFVETSTKADGLKTADKFTEVQDVLGEISVNVAEIKKDVEYTREDVKHIKDHMRTDIRYENKTVIGTLMESKDGE